MRIAATWLATTPATSLLTSWEPHVKVPAKSSFLTPFLFLVLTSALTAAPPEPFTQPTDQEVFQTLDLERPDLRAVKAALDKSDLAGAKAALVAHFRTRQRPLPPELSPDGSKSGLNAADEIVDRVFRFVGCPPTKLGPQLRWNEDPHNYDQWPIALNRHFHWVTLGRAYAATKDEKYAREFVAQFRGWVGAGPIYIGPRWIEGPYFAKDKAPLSLDAGIRMAQTWWPAFYYFNGSLAFDVESQFLMLRSFREHAIYLMDPRAYHAGNNWGAMETAGLLHLAIMLPEFKESAEWLKTARQRLIEMYKAQAYLDGAQIELTPGYHGVTLSNFLSAMEVTRRNGVSLPADFADGLERMFEYYMAIALPDGTSPALNDSGWGRVSSWLVKGHELFPARRDFEYLATGGKRGMPPAKTSWALPYAGWYVMRTGWKEDDRYLLLEAGPYGAAHQHEDKLSLVLHAGRKTILTEGGNYSYDTSDWRRYVLSTRAHNTVMVDGLEQNRKTQRDTRVVWQPAPSRWITNADFDYAEGVYDSGYGPENKVRVSHRRQVVFVKPDYWLVIDTMTPEDAAAHYYEAIFHLDADEAKVDSGTKSVTVEYDGHAFRILPLSTEGLEVEIVQGRKKPTVQGWLPTGRHNELRPIPTAVFRRSGSGPTVMAYALIPRRPGESWEVAGVRTLSSPAPGAMVAELQRSDDTADHLLRREPNARPVKVGPLETGSDVAVVRVNAVGAVLKTLEVDAKQAQD